MTNFAGFYVLGDSEDDEAEIQNAIQKFKEGSRDFNYLLIPLESIGSLVWIDGWQAWRLYFKGPPEAMPPYVGIDGKNLPSWLFDKMPLHTLT